MTMRRENRSQSSVGDCSAVRFVHIPANRGGTMAQDRVETAASCCRFQSPMSRLWQNPPNAAAEQDRGESHGVVPVGGRARRKRITSQPWSTACSGRARARSILVNEHTAAGPCSGPCAARAVWGIGPSLASTITGPHRPCRGPDPLLRRSQSAGCQRY